MLIRSMIRLCKGMTAALGVSCKSMSKGTLSLPHKQHMQCRTRRQECECEGIHLLWEHCRSINGMRSKGQERKRRGMPHQAIRHCRSSLPLVGSPTPCELLKSITEQWFGEHVGEHVVGGSLRLSVWDRSKVQPQMTQHAWE